MAAINIFQHGNSIPEKSQRKADKNQAATSPNHLFLLIGVFPSGYYAKLHLRQKIKQKGKTKKQTNKQANKPPPFLKVTGEEN